MIPWLIVSFELCRNYMFEKLENTESANKVYTHLRKKKCINNIIALAKWSEKLF